MIRRVLSTYLPDRPPTWTEVGIAVLVVVTYGFPLHVRRPWWPAVILGFVLFVLALGPIANTSIGRRIGNWFREIGLGGRAVAIGLLALTTVVVSRTMPGLMELLGNAAYGGLAAVVLFIALHLLIAGEISGWLPDRSDNRE